VDVEPYLLHQEHEREVKTKWQEQHAESIYPERVIGAKRRKGNLRNVPVIVAQQVAQVAQWEKQDGDNERKVHGSVH